MVRKNLSDFSLTRVRERTFIIQKIPVLSTKNAYIVPIYLFDEVPRKFPGTYLTIEIFPFLTLFHYLLLFPLAL